MRVVKNLSTLLLHLDAGIGVFLAKDMHELGERGGGGLGFVGRRKFVEDGLKVFRGARKLMSRLVSAGSFNEKLRLGRSGSVGVERVNRFLRVTQLDCSRGQRLQQLLAQGGVRIVVLKSL